MSVIKIKDNSLGEIIKEGAALVDFYADWCGPCKMVAPIMSEIADEHPEIKVCKVNVDDAYELAAKFGIVNIPTIIAFKDGAEIGRVVGYRPKADILAVLDK